MSFTFGQPAATTTAAPAFGTNTLSGGTLFGGGDSKPFQSPSSTDNKVNYFSSPTTSAPAFSSFSFGGNKTTAATSGFFTSPTTTTASSAFGAYEQQPFRGFASDPKPAGGSSDFGQTATQNAPQNLSFGQTTTTQQQPFGTPPTQAPATFGFPSKSSFSLPKPANQPTTPGFSFTSTSGFAAPQPTVISSAQPTQSSFTLTPVTTSTTSGFAPSFKEMFGKSTFSFAPTTAATTTPVASTSAAPPAFGTTSPSFGISQPSTLGSQQPTIGFGQAQTTTGATTPSYQFNTATSFASQPVSVASQPASQPKLGFAPPITQSTPASSQPSLPTSQPAFGGSLIAKPTATGTLGLFSGIVSSAAPQITPSVVNAASTGATGFSVSSVTTAATSQPVTTSMAFSTSAMTGGISFAKPTVTTTTTSIAATSAPTGMLSLGKSTAASTMPSLTTTTTTTALAPPQPISSITFSQLEENINKWTLELEEQEKIFINQATQINAWDRLLISNGEMIVELNDTIQTVKNEQQSLEHELDFVLAQQKELEEILTPIEKKLLNEMGDRLRDPEREHMYSLAENLDSQLRQMSEDLKEVIEHLNETNRSQDTNDPIVQIGRILNAHMSSMQWIDNSIAQISTKLDQLKTTHDTLRRDNERSFQLTYN